MTVIDDGEKYDIPSVAQQVFDVSGAGDTVVATLCMGMICGGTFKESAELANRAAGIVVGKIGTVPISLDDLK
jgi:D-beta-D-heptose 7-phosphate kinase/D-beta-D-heptose 1-phosphate adenosyltransferase